MPDSESQSESSLRDNRKHRGTVGVFLKTEIQPGSYLSFVSAYFTVHAYEALATQLESTLLDSAMESIKRTFARRATNALLAGRDGLLPMTSETPTSSDDMELVTWLIIMQP